ncbi:hypothetical protein PENSPDRAFT_760481 [Peniophora sp. CONT]|nr:hypothetical protein PENSPDRAFT_760481 [Peniophora sp. CONT]
MAAASSILEDALLAALNARSPSPEPAVTSAAMVQPVDDSNIDPRLRGNKRARVDDDVSEPEVAIVEENLVLVARRAAVQRRFSPERAKELVDFAKASPGYKLVLLMAIGMDILGAVEKIHAAAPVFKASDALKANLTEYAWALLLCSQIPAYTGDKLVKYMINLVRRLTSDLPPGIENVPASWAEVVREASYAATQVRAAIKKHVKESEDTDVFTLAIEVAAHGKIAPTLPLAARIALLRRVYSQTPGSGFWPAVDAQLEALRKQANGDAARLVRGFRFILNHDITLHGNLDVETYESDLPDVHVVDDRQRYAEDAVLDTPAIEAIEVRHAAARAASQSAPVQNSQQAPEVPVAGPSASADSA